MGLNDESRNDSRLSIPATCYSFVVSLRCTRLELKGSIELSFFRNFWFSDYFFRIKSCLYLSLTYLRLTNSSWISSAVFPEWAMRWNSYLISSGLILNPLLSLMLNAFPVPKCLGFFLKLTMELPWLNNLLKNMSYFSLSVNLVSGLRVCARWCSSDSNSASCKDL